jgi:NAD(P)-dependent dehydrogenase (short-subunit alcohol dehydrogenase family)
VIAPGDFLLTGQVAFITGGAMGIGAGIAAGYAAFGADVVLADIDIAAAERTAQRISAETGRQALAIACDVADPAQIRAAVEQTLQRFGRLDLLVNNAAGVRPAPFLELSERSRERHLQLNLGNLFSATDAAVRAMIAGGRGGSVLNVASIEGQRAAPHFAVYGACKAAMLSLTQSLALELAEHGIRVNAIAPDHIVTEGMVRMGGQAPERVSARQRYVPLGRDGEVDDCAGAAVYLASPMARYITGTVLNIDGGTRAASGWVRGRAGGWNVVESN